MTKAEHIDALLHAWDEMDNAAARISTSLPAQMTESAARLERVRLETRAVVQRAAMALSAPEVSAVAVAPQNCCVPTAEQVERGARAIVAMLIADDPNTTTWDDATEEMRAEGLAIARACLTATPPAPGADRAAVIEECAKIAETKFAGTLTSNIGHLIAEAIRAMGCTVPRADRGSKS